METYDARLASFKTKRKKSKKGNSEAKGAKAFKWPHTKPSPSELARAGFYYEPSHESEDNAQCYLCHCNIDMWEGEDDPIEEHVKHSAGCGWANIVSIEHMIENGQRDFGNPMGGEAVNARSMTFDSRWPHEDKRGWTCKISKMVEAGWYFCPTPESDDFVKCAYCNLSLDGWEPKDNPFDEHLRRSPECFFFSTGAKSQAGGQARPKGKRASKASRVSNQSTLSVASEGMSIGELEPQESSVMSISSINTTSEPLGAKKKGTKTKKATKKAKGRTLQPMQDDSEVAGSYLEPEDDDFEVKIAATQKRGTKRTSDEIMTSAANDDGEGAEQDVEEHPNPPRKRRATKTRSTRANQAGEPAVVDDSLETTQLKDTQIAESMDMTIEEKVPVKKAQRGRKPKSSSTKRKTSTTSVASKASLRATVPNDEEIDAVLAEDLDRPLTDNGSDEDDSQITKPTKRPMAKTRAASNAGASAAPIRRATRTSSKTANDSITDGIRSHEEEPPLLQPEVSELESHELPMPKSRKGNTRKASAKEKPKASAKLSSALLETSQNGGADEAVSRTEPTKSRQASRQLVDKSGNALQDFDSNQAFGTDAMDDLTYPDVEQPVGELVQEQAINDQKTERPKRNQAKASPRVVRKEAETHLMDPSNEDVSEKASDEAKEQVGAEVEEDDLEKPVKKPGKGKKPAKAAKTGGKGSQGKKATSKELPEAEHVAAEPPPNDHAPSSPPPVASGKSTLDRGGQSPQSSDAENQPPSSRPTRSRPPLSAMSPVRQNEARVPLANITPSASPSKANISRLRSTLPWTAVDIDRVFQDTPGGVGDGDENGLLSVREVVTTKDLSSPEKKLTVEEWIKHNAVKAEERLRNDCERLVGRFENEGVRALKTLEGIVCVD